MRTPLRTFLAWTALVASPAGGVAIAEEPEPMYVLVIHGGAGPIAKKAMTDERRAVDEAALKEALRAGHAILKEGGRSVDAVEAAIRVMEDSSRFNAGKGAVFTADQRNELDASIVDGQTRKAGAVAATTIIKNPITAARAVMDRSKYVLLVGPGADQFAREEGLDIVPPSYFGTEERLQQLKAKIRREREKARDQGAARSDRRGPGDHPFGTVGAVALDTHGHLAAGASTGGLTGKHPGRVGDTAVVGAGTFAEDGVCAVSCTGDGEYFIRFGVAREIAAKVRYKGLSVEDAANELIHGTIKDAGGEGGVIAVDAKGHIAMPFNSEGMYRGYIQADGTPHVAIYDDEKP